jgi:hypothetical protein
MKIIALISLLVVSLFFAGISYAEINPANIAGLWLFDDGTAADSSGNGNNGTLMGDPQVITGVFGKALAFNGDDYVAIADSNSLDMNEQFTIMFWVRSDKEMLDMWADRQVVVGKHYLEYEIGIYMDGQLHTYTSNGAGDYDEGIMAQSVGAWAVGKWYHVAWTLNGAHETAYINGVNIGEYDKAHANTMPGEHEVNIGQRTEGGQPMTGAVDEVAILNVALAESDIVAAMNNGMGSLLNLSAVSPSNKLTTAWGKIKTQ